MTVEIIGPFKSRAVCVNGYRVPYLDACPVTGGAVLLTLDNRYMIEVSTADFDRTVEFIANCLAVAAGYTCHPGTEGAPEPIRRTGYGRMTELGQPGAKGTAAVPVGTGNPTQPRADD